jgi:hypothetical protein
VNATVATHASVEPSICSQLFPGFWIKTEIAQAHAAFRLGVVVSPLAIIGQIEVQGDFRGLQRGIVTKKIDPRDSMRQGANPLFHCRAYAKLERADSFDARSITR